MVKIEPLLSSTKGTAVSKTPISLLFVKEFARVFPVCSAGRFDEKISALFSDGVLDGAITESDTGILSTVETIPAGKTEIPLIPGVSITGICGCGVRSGRDGVRSGRETSSLGGKHWFEVMVVVKDDFRVVVLVLALDLVVVLVVVLVMMREVEFEVVQEGK